MEIWKDIKGYEGLYQISNLGRVKSLIRNKILNGGNGEYKTVGLYKNEKVKYIHIHKLVALMFIPNPNNLTHINHINENKHDNSADNLEWCTNKYNINYGSRNYKLSKAQIKYNIIQKDLKNNVIKIWESAWKIKKELGYNIDNIRKCCRAESKTAFGYKWEYLKIANRK